jgi:cyclophilin family peptidyl-prolyl cis-trans isomerase
MRANYYDAYPDMVIDTNKEYEAIIRTEKGDMRLRLFDDESPLAVNNFVFLSQQGFYDGLTFHRVLEDFMAQGGDPSGTGGAGPGYQFADEVDNGLTFDRRGLLAMANGGPATNGSQFFITFVPTPHLNGLHTIFGEVIEGDAVLDQIARVAPGQPGDVIERIDIVEK